MKKSMTVLFLALQAGLFFYSPNAEGLEVSVALCITSALLNVATFRRVSILALLAGGLSLAFHYYFGQAIMVAIVYLAVILGFITVLCLFFADAPPPALGYTTLGLAILSVVIVYLQENVPELYVNLFMGYWLWLPFVMVALATLNERLNPEVKKRRKEHKKRIATLKQEKEGLLEKQQKQTENHLDLVRQTVAQLERDLSHIRFQKEENPKRKWLTLDEKYAYLDGLQGRLEFRYKKDYPSRYGRENVLNLSLSQNILALGHQQDINVLEWKRLAMSRLQPFQNYSYKLLEKKEIENQHHVVEAGIRGEEALEKELEFISDNLTYLTNVRVEVDGMSSESDALVFSPYGIFTIEAKNFGEAGRFSIHISKDGKWTRKFGNNSQPMNDVVAQNNRHVLAKEKILNRELKKRGLIEEEDYIEINGVITITNDVVDIQNDSDFPVIRLSHLHPHIRKGERVYTKEQLGAMQSIFEEAMLPPQRFPQTDYEAEYNSHKAQAVPILNAYQPLIDLDVRIHTEQNELNEKLHELEKQLANEVLSTQTEGEN